MMINIAPSAPCNDCGTECCEVSGTTVMSCPNCDPQCSECGAPLAYNVTQRWYTRTCECDVDEYRANYHGEM